MTPEPRPANVDVESWEFAARLGRRGQVGAARRALTGLADAGYPTALAAHVEAAALASLAGAERAALVALLGLARQAGLRTQALPRWSPRTVERLRGVDPATAEFVSEARQAGPVGWKQGPILWYLGHLAAAGASTRLDADLDAEPLRSVVRQLIKDAENERLDGFPIGIARQRSRLISAISTLYDEASRAGLRERPNPPWLQRAPDLRGEGARLHAMLPEHDRARLDRLSAKLDRLMADQQAGRAGPRGRSRRRVGGAAQTTVRNYGGVRNKLIRHALFAGWRVDFDSMLTPERVVEFLFRGQKVDGSPMGPREPEERRSPLLGLLQKALDLGEPLVSAARVQEIVAAVAGYHGSRNVVGETEVRRKFIPSPGGIETALEVIEQDYLRKNAMYERGQLPHREMWREAQQRLIAVLSLKAMLRNDSIGTLNLLSAERNADTGTVKIRGVRAKETGDHHYIELTLLPEEVDYLDELLAFEGRSVEQPLRDGEAVQVLRAERLEDRDGQTVVVPGDRWGSDRRKTTGLEVAGVFRASPFENRALTYGELEHRRREILRRVGWSMGVPHTFRMAGAIYWKYVRGMDDEWIMTHGHWRDLKTLRQCYLLLEETERTARMAASAPSKRVGAPTDGVRGRRAAAARLHAAVGDLQAAREPGVADYERLAARCREALAQIERANAGERGRSYVEPRVPLLDDEELISVDLGLRPLYAGGIKDIVGRDIFAADRVRDTRPPRPTRRSDRVLRAYERKSARAEDRRDARRRG